MEVLYSLSRPTDKAEAHIGYTSDMLEDWGIDLTGRGRPLSSVSWAGSSGLWPGIGYASA